MPKLREILNFFNYNKEKKDLLNAKERQHEFNTSKDNINKKIYDVLSVNLEYIKKVYNVPVNEGIEIREFELNINGKQYRSFFVFIEEVVNLEYINNFIITPLLNNKENNQSIVSTVVTDNISVKKMKKFDLEKHILKLLIPQNSIKQQNDFLQIIGDINSGKCILFVETLQTAFSISIMNFNVNIEELIQNQIKRRRVFVKNLNSNKATIRKIVNNEKLIIENLIIGNIIKTKCSIIYIKEIEEEKIERIKTKINNLDVDYLINGKQLKQLLKDKELRLSKKVDDVIRFLLKGGVVIFVNDDFYVLKIY